MDWNSFGHVCLPNDYNQLFRYTASNPQPNFDASLMIQKKIFYNKLMSNIIIKNESMMTHQTLDLQNENKKNKFLDIQPNIIKSLNKNDDTNSDEFKKSVQRLVRYLEQNDGEQSIISLSIAFGITRKRIYDVINVFNSLGMCKKTYLDSITWIDMNNIKIKFDTLIKQKNINDLSLSLVELFPIENCIGIYNITTSLVLLFYALRTDHIDVRDAAHFFARQSSRLKTTLNKIYQISRIMGAVELMKKSSIVGEVLISQKIFNVDVIPDRDESEMNLDSIQYFLNDENETVNAILKRRKEFRKYL